MLGLIGSGYWGKNLARNFHDLGVLHTICDHNQEILKSCKTLYPSVHVSTDVQSVLQNPSITAVAIATPAGQHYTLAKQALLAGKDVFIEKPMCFHTHEGEELIMLSRKKERILMVGHILHYHPCFIKLQQVVSSEELGRLQYIASNRLNLAQSRPQENVLWDIAPHDISMILSLCEYEPPLEVQSCGGNYRSPHMADITLVTLKFSQGVRAHIYVSWLNPFKEQKLTVVCSSGVVVFDDTKPWGEKLLLYRNSSDSTAPEKIDPPELEPLKEECKHFLHCCGERLHPRTDGEEALQVLKILQAAQENLDQALIPTLLSV